MASLSLNKTVFDNIVSVGDNSNLPVQSDGKSLPTERSNTPPAFFPDHPYLGRKNFGAQLNQLSKLAAGFAKLSHTLDKALTEIKPSANLAVLVTLTGPLRDIYHTQLTDQRSQWSKFQVRSLFDSFERARGVRLHPLTQAQEQMLENEDFLKHSENQTSLKESAEAADLPFDPACAQIVLSVGGSSTQVLGHENVTNIRAKMGANGYVSSPENYQIMINFVQQIVHQANVSKTTVVWACNAWGYRIEKGDFYVFSRGKSCTLPDDFSLDFQKALDETESAISVILLKKSRYPIEGAHARSSLLNMVKENPGKDVYLIEMSSGQIKLLQKNEEGLPLQNKVVGKYPSQNKNIAKVLIEGSRLLESE